MRSLFRVALVAATASCATALLAGALLIPTEAPEWETSGWLNGSPGKLSELRGKVVLIEFFQLWCPVCNSFSIPLFQHWNELYGGRDDVAIVSIHTVFEGHDVQTVKRLREFVQEKGILYPVGLDAYDSPKGTIPVSMRRFKTEGTPQIAIVDKGGMLRWSHFGKFDPAPVEALIDRLLGEKTGSVVQIAQSQPQDEQASSRGAARTGPARRGGGPGAGRGGGRRHLRGAPVEEPEEPEEPEQKEEEPEIDVSGKYRLTLDLQSNSCGETLPPQTVFADFAAANGRIEVTFSRRYFGQQQLSLDYDSLSGTFQANTSNSGEEEGAEVALSLSVSGHFIQGAATPELQFQFQLEKAGAAEEGSCTIAGSGSGGKTGA